ncbi:MAG: Polyprenyl synthetase [Thermoanaerobacterales bacterium 50_218]|nr:MAG: Polyprenyl synthetase [Thermoanaerobacterales bacterium 50_218]HAA90460.1 geranyl transferase [Peptococcaceae bacterium]
MTWEGALVAKAEMINEALNHYLPSESVYPPLIHEAMRYSLFAGGKRLRGALTLATAEALGLKQERVLAAACALEMIHTYSLIHDDLPAMDDDDFRRGKPTCHRVYGEAIAILAGDALLTLAFGVLCRLRESGFSPGVILQVIEEVATAAGTKGLIGGQVVDLESEGCEVSPDTVEYIHLHKTAALFRAAVRCGALLAGADQQKLGLLTDYAVALGMAFQITDDILDLIGDEKVLGKPVKSDLAKEKATYPSVFGLEQAREMAAFYVDKALQALETLGPEFEFLRGAACYLLQRRS